MPALEFVWTEREADIPLTAINEGDWEACVATSYSMALRYGGVKMEAPYTQKQRELIEAVKDSPQDLGVSDQMSLKVYGVKLRPLSPGITSATQAISRPGVGLCLTGVGSPGGYQAGTFTHEVFWAGISTVAGLLYDPLAPPGSRPQTKTIATMAAWVKGIAAHQIREIRIDEFAGGNSMIESLKGYPPGTVIPLTAGVTYNFFEYDANGNKIAWSGKYATNTSAATEALVDLTNEGPAHFLPKIYQPGVRFHQNVYLGQAQATPIFPNTPEPDDEAIAAAASAAALDVAAADGSPILQKYAREKYPQP